MRCRAPSTAAGSPRYSESASRIWDSERRPVAVGSDPSLCEGIRPPRQHPFDAEGEDRTVDTRFFTRAN